LPGWWENPNRHGSGVLIPPQAGLANSKSAISLNLG
jgi:hypothetical protein